MKNLILIFVLLVVSLASFSQATISGTVIDSETGETLIGANIIIKETTIGTVSDIDGNYFLRVENGEYTIAASYVGYKSIERKIKVDETQIEVDFDLTAEMEIEEVMIVADVARTRETPVAFSTITPQKLQEIIAAQDIPMVLNSTPGVYATTEGGGDGDAQVTIRGFSARNVGVLLDGVPVNDMENGHVYWSN